MSARTGTIAGVIGDETARRWLRESGFSIGGLARGCELHRTSLERIMNGQPVYRSTWIVFLEQVRLFLRSDLDAADRDLIERALETVYTLGGWVRGDGSAATAPTVAGAPVV